VSPTNSSRATQIFSVAGSQPRPSNAAEIDSALLHLFRVYREDDQALPYDHQATTFSHILSNEEVALTAGTAAGKTLAIGVPLVHKLLVTRAIHKVVLLYPTRALLEDQSNVMHKLVRCCLSLNPGNSPPQDPTTLIGRVRGGLSSSQLIAQLGKPLVLATPDAIYWLLRKNVKFSMALIYGLAQADELVVDEAHLLTGLMLHNTVHLLDRLRAIGETYLNRVPRIHYLTATGNDSTRRLSPRARVVTGVSLSGPVRVTVSSCPREDSEVVLQQTLYDVLAQGRERVLVVCNSARRAHILFNQLASKPKSRKWRESVPPAFWRQFGLIQVEQAAIRLDRAIAGVGDHIREAARTDLSIRTRDLAQGQVTLRAEYLVQLGACQIERDVSVLRRALEHPDVQDGGKLRKGKFGQLLQNWNRRPSDELPRLPQDYSLDLEDGMPIETALIQLDANSTLVAAWFEKAIDIKDDGYGIPVNALDAATFDHVLTIEGQAQKFIGPRLCSRLARALATQCVLDDESIQGAHSLPFSLYKDRQVPVRRVLGWLASFPAINDALIEVAADTLINSGIVHAAVGLLKNSTVPDDRRPIALLYSGSIARYNREGIIDVFGRIESRQVVLFSTSAVEVGVDFEADALVTEECEGSSFLQRFGRVGRRPTIMAEAHVLCEPATAARLFKRLTIREQHAEITRPEFSAAIDETFAKRSYLATSLYADSLHVLVTRQIGRTGKRLAAKQSTEAIRLAEQVKQADINIAYGLRSTLPAVALADEGVSKDPFYIFNYVEDDAILPPTSPFEVARLDRGFNSLLFNSAWRMTFVLLDGDRGALAQCLALTLMDTDGPVIVSLREVNATPATLVEWFDRGVRTKRRIDHETEGLAEPQRTIIRDQLWQIGNIPLPAIAFARPDLLLVPFA